MPETAFPMKADLAKREPGRLGPGPPRTRTRATSTAPWPADDCCTTAPYSNNHIHMGTAANKIWKDAAVRQASLQGFDAPYVPGWDNHGMPIEMQVGREFAEKKQKPTRLELRRACREYAQKWIGIQREEFIRLGGWGDWFRPYLTMAPEFEAEILETLARLHARGAIQRGKRSIHWCPTDARRSPWPGSVRRRCLPQPVRALPAAEGQSRGHAARWPEAGAVA
jgi:isoleucyl-tRNA synthetase